MRLQGCVGVMGMAVLLAVASKPAFAAATCKQTQLASLEVEIDEDGTVLVPARIDGHDVWVYLHMRVAVPMIYARAVEGLGLQPKSQDDLTMSVGGQPVTKKVFLSSLQLGTAKFMGWDMYVVPNPTGGPAMPLRGAPIVGTISSGLFGTADIELNLAQKQVKLFERTDCGAGAVYWSGDVTTTTLGIDGLGLWTFPLEMDGKMVEASFNTGGSTSRISELVTDKFFGFNSESPGITREMAANGSEVASYRAMALTARELALKDVPMRLDDDMDDACLPRKFIRRSIVAGQERNSSYAIGFDCLSKTPVSIGTDLLRELRIYIAPGQGKVYFTRVGQLPVSAPAAAPSSKAPSRRTGAR